MHKDNDPKWQAIWPESREKYLQGVNQFYSQLQQTSSGDSAFASESLLNAWSEVASSTLPKELFPVFNNLLNQTASINSLSQAFNNMLASLSETQEDNDAWIQVLHHHIDSLKEKLADSNNNLAYTTMHKSLVESMQYWQDCTAAIDDPVFQVSDTPDMSKLFEKMSGIPAIAGNTRYTEEIKLAAGRWGEYQRAYIDYQAVLADIALLAIDKLRDKLIHFGLSGRKIKTLKHLYDLWIEVQEDAYSEIVFTEQYAKKFAELINLYMSFRKHTGRVSEIVFENANEGMREELKVLFDEQKQMSKALEQSQQALSESKIKIDVLEQELIELRNMITSNKKERE